MEIIEINLIPTIGLKIDEFTLYREDDKPMFVYLGQELTVSDVAEPLTIEIGIGVYDDNRS